MTHPALQIHDLKFRYDGIPSNGGEWTIDLPRLELERGEQVLLTGSSGRGKSTLMHLICGLIDPSQGEVLVDGQAIHGLHGAARDRFRGRTIGVIFQNFNLLYGFSALENVMAALMFSTTPPKQHRRRAAELLAHLGIDEQDRDPHRMSIGQQQRVAVARAVACEPALVLADEPTASLDPENATTALELIRATCREANAALLCVSHDPALAERFERRETL
jgi:ABC-type lipoprotein export system ATPase subunit